MSLSKHKLSLSCSNISVVHISLFKCKLSSIFLSFLVFSSVYLDLAHQFCPSSNTHAHYLNSNMLVSLALLSTRLSLTSAFLSVNFLSFWSQVFILYSKLDSAFLLLGFLYLNISLFIFTSLLVWPSQSYSTTIKTKLPIILLSLSYSIFLCWFPPISEHEKFYLSSSIGLPFVYFSSFAFSFPKTAV